MGGDDLGVFVICCGNCGVMMVLFVVFGVLWLVVLVFFGFCCFVLICSVFGCVGDS